MIIRRPLVFLCLAFALGIGSYYIFNPNELLYICGIFLTSLILIFYWLFTKSVGESKNNHVKNQIVFHIILWCLIFNLGGLWSSVGFNKSDGMENYYETEVTYYGYGIKYDKKSKDFAKITLKNGKNRYLLYVYGKGVSEENIIGSKVYFKGKAKRPDSRRNPGTFDYRLYLKTQKINTFIKCDVENIKTTKPQLIKNPQMYLYNKLTCLKCKFLNKVKPIMSKSSYGILEGMLFGNKDNLDEITYEAFQKNGIAHILSVSGIHVGIVYGFFIFFFGKKIGLTKAIVLISFIFMYGFLAQFSPSVVRASIMISIHIISKLINRPYDLLTGTMLAALIMLIMNPLSLFHVGFQLSFMAVILLAFSIPFFKRYIGEKKIIGAYKQRFKDEGLESKLLDEKFSKKIIDTLLPLVIIQCGMALFTAFVFNYISVAGLFLNIPIIFIASLAIPLGIALIPLSIVKGGIVTQFPLVLGSKILDFIFQIMVRVNQAVFEMPFLSFQVTSPPPWIVIGFYGLMFFFLSETFRILKSRNKFKKISLIVSFILIGGLLCSFTQVCSRDNSDIVFLDVGQGDAIHLRTPSGKNVLIDGGGSADYNVGKNVLMPYFLKNGVKKIDYAFVTHLHTDHFKGVKELSNYIEVDNIITYEGSRVRTQDITSGSGIKNDDIVYVGGGDSFLIDDGIKMDIIYPKRKNIKEYKKALEFEEDENMNSLFMKLSYGNSSVLITGDLNETGEKMIIDDLKTPRTTLKSTILKVGHHGSKYSTSDEFLNLVDPETAVIQVSKSNTYGHPAPQVIEKLTEKDIMVLRNDTDGAILLKYEKGRFVFRKMICEN